MTTNPNPTATTDKGLRECPKPSELKQPSCAHWNATMCEHTSGLCIQPCKNYTGRTPAQLNPDTVLKEAQEITAAFNEKVYGVKHFEPLDTVLGCLTQIDNMVTGLPARNPDTVCVSREDLNTLADVVMCHEGYDDEVRSFVDSVLTRCGVDSTHPPWGEEAKTKARKWLDEIIVRSAYHCRNVNMPSGVPYIEYGDNPSSDEAQADSVRYFALRQLLADQEEG